MTRPRRVSPRSSFPAVSAALPASFTPSVAAPSILAVLTVLALSLTFGAVPAVSQGTVNPVFVGDLQKSTTGASILPVAWVHEDLLVRGEWDVTFLFLYHDAITGEQTKLATVTVAMAEDDGTFESSGWGDVGRIHGTVGRTVTVDRVVISNGEKPRDDLRDLTFAIQGQPSEAPAAGRWPLIRTLPITVTKPKYTDFWTVELNVETTQGKAQAILDYYGPEGTYPADPVTILPDGSFKGTAGNTKAGVRFAGVFLTLDDGEGGEAANFPLLVQAPTKSGTAWRMSEAVGTRPILWLTENESRKSGVHLHTANYSTAAQAQVALDTLFKSGKVLAADTDDATTRGTTNPPNDTYFNPAPNPGQYPYPIYNAWLCCTGGIVPARANDAWGVNNATGQGISLAVLDSGILAHHPDLQGRIQGGHNALRWPWWIDWLRLWIPANWRTTVTDLYGHGTGVSGVATAVRNNNEGIAGVAQPTIRPVRVLDQHNAASDTSVAEGLQWLLDNDHGDILNMSFVSQSGADTHGGNWDPVVAELVRRAVDGGRVPVGGSGNIPTPVVLPPASLPDVLAVGASDPNQDPTDYTAFGKNLDLLAPGGDNQNQADYVTVPWLANHNCADLPFDNDPNYCRKFGTSFAAPFVSGVVSMILTVHPNLQRTDPNCTANPKACVAQIRALVQRTGQAVQTPNWGLANVTDIYDVDAYRAVTTNLPNPLPPATHLQVANCAAGNCINPGIQLQWNAAVAPGGFNLRGYLVFRNGRPIFQNLPSPNPVVVNGTNYNDTTLPATHAGVPQAGTYTYTVVALYQDANNQIYEQAISSNHVRKTCNANGCN